MRTIFDYVLIVTAAALLLSAAPTVTRADAPPGPGHHAYFNEIATLSINPPSYTGSCPASIWLNGTIDGSSGSPARYHFRFLSPGAKAPVSAPTYTGTLGTSGSLEVSYPALAERSGNGWAEIVLAPPDALVNGPGIPSRRLSFSVHCTSIRTATVWINAPTDLRTTTNVGECERHGVSVATCNGAMSQGAAMTFRWSPQCAATVLAVTPPCLHAIDGYKLLRVKGKQYKTVAVSVDKKVTAIFVQGTTISPNHSCYVAVAYKGTSTSPVSNERCVDLAVVPPPRWTGFSKPFDLAWDQNRLDGNGLPLNPVWAAQLGVNGNPPAVPNFQNACGSNFNDADAVDPGRLSLQMGACTSQATTFNPARFSGLSLCPYDPIGGHVNWTYVTYTGTLQWAEWSGPWWNDDDINLSLTTSTVPGSSDAYDAGLAGLTANNTGSIGLEFDQGETLDNYSWPFWANLDEKLSPGQLTAPNEDAAYDNKFAVVTGVMGIDGVHGGYSEIHPVLALALLEGSAESSGGLIETWQFFVRNSGDEGECSSKEVVWPARSLLLSIPWPTGATGARLLRGGITAQASDPTEFVSFVGNNKGWSYISFPMNPQFPGFFDGAFSLQFTSASTGRRHVARNMTRKAHESEEAGWSAALARIRDASSRKRLIDFLKVNEPPRHARIPDRFRAKLATGSSLRVVTSATGAEREQLSQIHYTVDPGRKKATDDFHNKLESFLRAHPEVAASLASPNPEPQRR